MRELRDMLAAYLEKKRRQPQPRAASSGFS
jgi:hypothetical protein